MAGRGVAVVETASSGTLSGGLLSFEPTTSRLGSRKGWSAIVSTNRFKNGNHIEVDGTIFGIVDLQHVKPGRGGAYLRRKLRRAGDGDVIDPQLGQTDPGLRGGSLSGGGIKPARLETGAIIQGALFIEQGQRIRVDTRSGDHMARA